MGGEVAATPYRTGMSEAVLRLTVTGPRDSFTWATFQEIIGVQLDGLRDVQAARSVDGAGWFMHHTFWNGQLAVDMAAAPMQGGPLPEAARAIPRFYVEQFGLFDADQGIPPDFQESTLEKFAKVAKRAEGTGVESFGAIDLATREEAQLSSEGRQVLADLVEPRAARRGVGAVTGTVETVGIRGGTWFTVYDDVFGRAVRCVYEDALAEEVAAALGRRVTVDGDLLYNRKGHVNRVSVRSLDVLPRDEELPTLAQMAGSMPGIRFDPDGLNAEIERRGIRG